MSSLRIYLPCLMLCLALPASNAFAVMRMSQCPEPTVQAGFNITQYMGRWFEYQRFPNTFEMGSKCVIANYTLTGANSVKVVNVALQEYSYGTGICPWYRSTVAVGDAAVEDPNVPAKLGVRFSEYQPRGNYWVVETDYQTYSVVYSCSSMYGMFNVETAWILTRERGVPPSNLKEIEERLTGYGIDTSYFEVTDNAGCPEWPKKDEP